MKNKELLAVLAVSTIATSVLTGCGQAAQIGAESVSETSISSDTISDDTVSDDSISEDSVSDDSVSDDSVSDETEELGETSEDTTTSETTTIEDDGLHDADGNFKLDDWWLSELKRLGATDEEIASVKSEKQLEALVNRLYSEGRTEDTRCDSCYNGDGCYDGSCYTPTCDTECFTCDVCDSCDNCFDDGSCYQAVGCTTFSCPSFGMGF